MTFNDLRTLQQAIVFFNDEQNCINAVAALRWPDGKPTCPACGHQDHYYLATQKRWKCKECWKQFSVKVGTIFEDSRIPLTKWMLAAWMITNCRNGVSSWEIHRNVGVTQKTAWFMLHRLRLSMHDGAFEVKLGGDGKEVEIDETFIGGKARNMHRDVKARKISRPGRNVGDKILVMGLIERGGRIRTQMIPHRKKHVVIPIVRDNVEKGSQVYTDALHSYRRLGAEYAHEVIDHAERYVNGKVHTNSMENFWSLLKRGLHGTYVSVEPYHLFRYLDEATFRFNNRNRKIKPVHDGQRFRMALANIAGKHITYNELTGKGHLPEPF